MGMDFRAVMGHRLATDDLFHIADKLNDLESLTPYFDSLNVGSVVFWSWGEAFQDIAEFSTWFQKNLDEDGVARLRGEHAIWICFSTRMAEIGSWVRWYEFVKTAEINSALRTICKAVAGVLGANRLAYFPDSGWEVSNRASGLLFENGTYEEFEKVMRSGCPPEQSFSDKLLAGGYFIEQVSPRSERVL
jgi:hypothetical protein